MSPARIGLEVHVQLTTATKLFCRCPARGDDTPNRRTCPVCLGMPGTLPVLDPGAARLAVRAAVALGATVQATSVFSRKSYFYPDLPKGYQLTQHAHPLARGGTIHAAGRAFRLTRLHLEEDAGRPTDDGIDHNRAGVALLEVVGEPDVESPEEAEAWLRVLHATLVAAGVTEGALERGHFRCDANVSVGDGARVEVKNVSSFRFVARALRAELARQAAITAGGGRVAAETRAWDGHATVAMRAKEDAVDYRWMDEPDLPPLVIPEDVVAAERARLPGVPLDLHLQGEAERKRSALAARHGLRPAEAALLAEDDDAARVLEAAVAAGAPAREAAAWLVGPLRASGLGRLDGEALAAVVGAAHDGTLTRDGTRRVLDVLVREGGEPRRIAAALGVDAPLGDDALDAAVAAVLDTFPGPLAKYRAGHEGMLDFLLGQVLARTARRADPARARARLLAAIAGGA